MKNHPSDRIFLVLAAAAALLAGTAAWSGADEGAATRKKRAAAIAGTETWVADLCKTADEWKILKFDPEGGAGLKDLKAAGLKKDATDKELKAKDADMPDKPKWDPSAMGGLRASVSQLREQCARLKDRNTGLPALTGKDVALENVNARRWSSLIEKFDEARIIYDGKTSRSDRSNSHYLTRYPDGAGKRMDKPSSIKKLSEDTVGYLQPVLDGSLAQVIKEAGADAKER